MNSSAANDLFPHAAVFAHAQDALRSSQWALPLRIGLVGTFPPRPCGLATLTGEVAPGSTYRLVQSSPASARSVAVELSKDMDVVLVEHEFGIFGGDSSVLGAFTDALTVPHGSPTEMYRAEGTDLRRVAGLAKGAKVIATFGLLSPSKGIELVIRAMRRVREASPDAVFVVAGSTDPRGDPTLVPDVSFTRLRARPSGDGPVVLAALRVDLDTVVICGSGDHVGIAGRPATCAVSDRRGRREAATARRVPRQRCAESPHGAGRPLRCEHRDVHRLPSAIASRTRLGDASPRTVSVALGTNVGVAAAKLVVAVFRRSTAMMAEASHALADCGNQELLVIAQHRSRRPADEDHPLGFGREAYFWAFIATVVVCRGTSFIVLYAVLTMSAALDSR